MATVRGPSKNPSRAKKRTNSAMSVGMVYANPPGISITFVDDAGLYERVEMDVAEWNALVARVAALTDAEAKAAT